MKSILYLCCFTLLYFSSCAPSRFVEPLKKKQLAVGGSLGGPVIDFGGKPVPVPLSSIEVGYGLDSNLTIHSGFHTTALLFGNFQMDAGITYKFLNQDKFIPNLTVNPGINYIQSFSEDVFKLWPTLDLNAYWNYGHKNNYFYAGVNNFFELSKTKPLNQPQTQRWLYNPQIGHVLKGKNQHFQFVTELKFMGLNQENPKSFVPWKSAFGKHGATGLYLGFRYLF